MSAHNVKRKRHSSRHKKRQHSHHDKRKTNDEHGNEDKDIVSQSSKDNPKRALNIDLAASDVDLVSSNRIDLTQYSSGCEYRKSCSSSIPLQDYRRFEKRISAPIIVAQSGSTVSTPYYINPLKEVRDIEYDLNDDEINAMIRSYRRMSKSRKSRPRAYSKTKTRRVSQKLFGLIESISTDNGYSLGKKEEEEEEVDESDYHNTLDKYGYVQVKVIAKSLQGIVISAKKVCDAYTYCSESVIIKITDKELYFNKMSNKHGKSLYVEEDIIKEKKLLMYLTANNPPKELTKFLGFFEDKYRFYVVMENGGNDFFDWVVKCHKWIRSGKISLKQWSLYIHDLMLQIVSFIKWLHCSMNVCHLDISLENMLIKNNKYKSDGNGGIRLSRKMQIKICDFGLAEYFEPKYGFLCRKYVGKTHYKAPKVYQKKEAFDARKADIWSLGVSFFMMIIGAPPYKLPIQSDDHYALIAKHNDIMHILRRWGRINYCNKYSESLLNAMLNCDPNKRCDITDIGNHLYFKQKEQQTILKIKKNKKRRKRAKSAKSNKNKPKNPITINHNIFENLVMSSDDGQLFKYRKRKITST